MRLESIQLSILAGLLLATTVVAQNEDFDPPLAHDLDPDPDIIAIELSAEETTWEYARGVPTQVYAYNGTIPGPTIVGKVGDLVRVRFTNKLSEPTTVHWHGLEIPGNMDGSHISQREVQPGEGFEYEFRLLRDGLYWYHPHVRVFDQVERGLYGAILVRDPELEARLGLDQIEEHILVFDDILLDANLQVVPAFSFTDPLKKVIYALNGREGNHLLVNGRLVGERSLTVENGVMHRWHVLNAANTTFCRLDLNTDARVPMIQIGTDSGLIDKPIPRPPVIPLTPPGPNRTASRNHVRAGFGAASVTAAPHSVIQDDLQGIFLVPGERIDVVFVPISTDGAELRVFQFDWYRGRHFAEFDADGNIVLGDLPSDGRMPAQLYLKLNVTGALPAKLPRIPTTLRHIELLDEKDAIGILPVTLGHTLPDPAGNVTMFAQARFDMTPMGPKLVPLPASAIDSFLASDAHIGETWIWEITNLSHGDHPFHTHGFFFQPYEVEYIDLDVALFNRTLALPIRFPKDTVRVPARPNLRGRSKTILRALVRFDDTGRRGRATAEGETATFDKSGKWTSGGWLFHCHVLEHSGLGMLSFFEVRDAANPYELLGKHLDGGHGKPSLSGDGRAVPGHPLVLDLVDARANATVWLVAGLTASLAPFAGGTLVPSTDVVFAATTDAHGIATWTLEDWTALPSGTKFYAQAVFRDPAGPQGFALSNALSVQL